MNIVKGTLLLSALLITSGASSVCAQDPVDTAAFLNAGDFNQELNTLDWQEISLPARVGDLIAMRNANNNIHSVFHAPRLSAEQGQDLFDSGGKNKRLAVQVSSGAAIVYEQNPGAAAKSKFLAYNGKGLRRLSKEKNRAGVFVFARMNDPEQVYLVDSISNFEYQGSKLFQYEAQYIATQTANGLPVLYAVDESSATIVEISSLGARKTSLHPLSQELRGKLISAERSRAGLLIASKTKKARTRK